MRYLRLSGIDENEFFTCPMCNTIPYWVLFRKAAIDRYDFETYSFPFGFYASNEYVIRSDGVVSKVNVFSGSFEEVRTWFYWWKRIDVAFVCPICGYRLDGRETKVKKMKEIMRSRSEEEVKIVSVGWNDEWIG